MRSKVSLSFGLAAVALAACSTGPSGPDRTVLDPEVADRLPQVEHKPLEEIPEVTDDMIETGSGDIYLSDYVYRDLQKYAYAPDRAIFAVNHTGEISNWAFCRDGTGERCEAKEIYLAIQGCLELTQVAINNGFIDVEEADCKVLALGQTVVWKGVVVVNNAAYPFGSNLYGRSKPYLPPDPALDPEEEDANTKS